MKKLIYIAVAALSAMAFPSCDLDRQAPNAREDSPYKTFSEFQFARKGTYLFLRSSEAMSNVALPDFQSDLYNITKEDAGALIGIFSWDKPRMLGLDNIDSYYASYYQLVAQANHLVMRAEEALNKTKIVGDKKDKIALAKQYIAEARVMRAVAVYRLMPRFAKGAYNPATADRELGICLVKQFDSSPKSYPRSTKKESYEYALEQLDLAIADLSDGMNESDFPPYTHGDARIAQVITKDYAYAMKARIYLQMQEWQKAEEAVSKFIDRYPLTNLDNLTAQADKVAAVKKIYSTGSKENMIRLFADKDHGFFGDFLMSSSWRGGKQYFAPSFVPQQWVVNAYASDDIRKGVYIADQSYDGGEKVFMVSKFQGDPAYDTNPAQRGYLNAINLFNIGEAYLIRAEARAKQSKFNEAVSDLRALKAARGITDYTQDDPTKVLDDVRAERVRELIGEGVRLNDLVRWNMDMQRKEPQPAVQAEGVLGARAQDLHIPAGDVRFSWEFPLRDRQVNPYLKGNTNWGL